jgi:2Fe-2S ferredoxin
MVKVTYIEHSGERHEVDVPLGYSVMEGALNNGVPGIVADCGGACSCATCHVYVEPEWRERAGEPGETEDIMLEFAEERDERSRLSCQIKLTEELDGLVVRVPERQAA